jgi:hypothetical protein
MRVPCCVGGGDDMAAGGVRRLVAEAADERDSLAWRRIPVPEGKCKEENNMADMEQDGAVEATPPGTDHVPGADGVPGISGTPDTPGTAGAPGDDQGAKRRRQWMRRAESVEAGSSYVWGSGQADSVQSDASDLASHDPGSTPDADPPTPVAPRTRRTRPPFIASAAGIAVVGLVAGLVWAATSSGPSSSSGVSSTAAGSVLAVPSSGVHGAVPFTVPALKVKTASPGALTTVKQDSHQSAPPATSASTASAAQANMGGPGPALAPWPDPIGNWPLDETGGNTAYDIAANAPAAQNGTASDGWFDDGACLFSGTESQIYTGAPVLNTGAGDSFTVTAWVYLNTVPSNAQVETVVSQDASENSAFSLQYSAKSNRWEFSRAADDDSGSTAYASPSINAPALKTWTQLVGVYDASSQKEYLYVNGLPQAAQAVDQTPFASDGSLVIGRGKYDGANANWFDGAIKAVTVFDQALNSSQVAELAQADGVN